MRPSAEVKKTLLPVLAALWIGAAVSIPTAGRSETASIHSFTDPMNSTLAQSTVERYKDSAANGAASAPVIKLVNTLGDGAKAYITCRTSGRWVYVSPSDGSFRNPPAGAISDADIAFELGAMGTERQFTVSGYVDTCRVYGSRDSLHIAAVVDANNAMSFVQPAPANPSDPNYHKNFGFAEFTYSSTTCANPSHVDYADIAMGLEMITHDGQPQAIVGGLRPDAKSKICADLDSVSTPQAPWSKGCIKSGDEIVRVMAPNQVIGMIPGAFDGYFDAVHNEVMQKYSQMPLILGNITCSTNPASKKLTCGAHSHIFDPTPAEILTCTGPFQRGDIWAMQVICAAYHRGHMLVEDGTISGPSIGSEQYYKSDVHNAYARAVHTHLHTGRGYAFSKDDIINDDEVAGLICSPGANVKELRIFIGGQAD